ncbi:MAG: PLP-dependent aminotransferase family protein [Armatimonadetes bacterium]|nr:PLP-dependent aminotransferase family protein [Armatimonadota bacterium]
MTTLTVDPSSSLPAYRQVAEHIKQEIVVGNLTVGDRLPPVRELAQRVGISRLTVHRAYLSLVDQKVLEARQGSGTFVAPQQVREVTMGVLRQFTDQGPLIRFEETARRGQIRSFATHVPDPKLVDLRDFFADQIALAQEDYWNLYAPEPGGESQLRAISAKWFGLFHPDAQAENIYINNGFTSYRNFLAIHTRPGETVLTQDPSHLMANEFYRRVNRIPYAIDPGNFQPKDLEDIIVKQKIKAAIINPYFGTGTGEYWKPELMTKFIDLTAKYNIPVFYSLTRALTGFGNLEALPFPTNTKNWWFELQWRTITTASINITTTLVPPQYINILRTDYRDEPIPKIQQLAFARYLKRGMKEHLKRTNTIYAERASALYKILRSNLNPDIQINRPRGGHGMIVRLPKAIDSNWLFHRSIDEGVAVMPGEFMCHNAENYNMVRLSYGLLETYEIERAAPIASRVINAALDRPSQ